ncbi:hypothetical protein PR002_g25903 [Phytophthora rubi]|uniref:Uncharacterized protein n=1 Tax=Phytophthora rubi TaxID=129364 RepID=A0A6A3HZG2_9STRA|nr:hypothetical protein PR002_g25903 [Phytophthora rubi]
MKLLWIPDHAYGQWKLIRIHFLDAQAPETLDDMLSVFKVSYEANRQDIDSLLLTATLWNLESDSELLPSSGTIVDINEYSNLQLYNGKVVPAHDPHPPVELETGKRRSVVEVGSM